MAWTAISVIFNTMPLVAQNPSSIDSIHVFHFDNDSFTSSAVERDASLSINRIGESTYSSLNNTIVANFNDFAESDTTILYRVRDFFEPSSYPFSAAVKLFLQDGDSLKQSCSGTMISDYWLVTANHCFNIRQTHHNQWSPDSISTIVSSPSFYRGEAQPDIGIVEVDKAIFFSGSSFLSYPDIIFLRLEHPAGRLSGTVEMKISSSDDISEADTSLTFGYPAVYINYLSMPDEYENIYNGNELFFSQNVVESVDENRIKITGHSNPGQSGSSIFFYREGQWSSYGVLSNTSSLNSTFDSIDTNLSYHIRKLMVKLNPENSLDAEQALNISEIDLKKNYPNPFNLTTTIVYDIPDEDIVRIDIYDVLGRKVKSLVNETQRAGRYSINFDAGNFSSGIYFYRLQVGNIVQTRKMTLIK